ncbi:hypothetical protein WICPIJ_004602 [Wickerhamomyces pijperi]|uniref:Nuclear cap-binding protein subunit 2 n=1 Tax=Wickerhamomyces pijperi TaxID=599730 RepID=A0A9P8Q5I3_WICPI|nr:hypothetical protein WICPIJ_004602 [Wickerhamomyces pijperi]
MNNSYHPQSLEEFDEIKFNHSTARLDAPSAYLLKKSRRAAEGITNLRNSLKSGTIYIGNLLFTTTEERIYELLSKVGPIERVIMGLDKFAHTPCGFCFVIFKRKEDSLNAVKYLNGTMLDGKHLEIDLDPGFTDDRQFGRGKSGGQAMHDKAAVSSYYPNNGSNYYPSQQQQQQQQQPHDDRGNYSNMDVDVPNAPN